MAAGPHGSIWPGSWSGRKLLPATSRRIGARSSSDASFGPSISPRAASRSCSTASRASRSVVAGAPDEDSPHQGSEGSGQLIERFRSGTETAAYFSILQVLAPLPQHLATPASFGATCPKLIAFFLA